MSVIQLRERLSFAQFQDSLGKKICGTQSKQKKLGVVAYVCHPSYERKAYGPGQPRQKARLYLQNTQTKKGLGVV
jgi:hypothetical protein